MDARVKPAASDLWVCWAGRAHAAASARIESYCAEPPCRARAAKEPPMKLPRTVGLAVAVSLVAATVAALA